MQKHVEKQPELPPDMQRLSSALRKLFEHALRCEVWAEQAERNEQHRQSETAGASWQGQPAASANENEEGTGEHTTPGT